MYRTRRLVETTTSNPEFNKQSDETSEDTHLYLQQKAELDNVEHQRYEVEAGDETRYETQGGPIFELPTEDTMLGRQELRAFAGNEGSALTLLRKLRVGRTI